MMFIFGRFTHSVIVALYRIGTRMSLALSTPS